MEPQQNIKLEWFLSGQMDIEYFKTYLPWANFRMVPTEGENPTLVLKDNNDIIGFASLHHDSNGINLNYEIFYPKIQWKITWLEINPLYKRQGHGTTIINYIKNKFAETRTPIALYAKQSGTDCRLDLWYYKLGAIVLWNEEYPGNMSYQCFMGVDQVPEYIDDDDLHNVNDIVEFEKKCSNRRVCKNMEDPEDPEENITCGWVLRNTETECGSCLERENRKDKS